MSYEQVTADNILGFYGTNQINECVPFKLPLPEQLVGLVQTNPDDSANCVVDPCYTLTVFEEDKNSFLYDYPVTTGNANFAIQKYDGVVWNTVANPLSATEGVLFDIGTIPDYPSYADFQVDWGLVFANYGGAGIYRFVVLTDDPVNNLISPPFQLYADSCAEKNGTFKIEITNQGDYFNFNYTRDNLRKREYNLVRLKWEDSVRHTGVMVKSEIESEDTFLNYDDSHDLLVFSEDRDQFDIKIPQLSNELLGRLYNYGLRAERVTITDYNTNNQKFYNKVPIKANGNYSFERRPRVQLLDTISIPVQYEFVRRYKKI